MLRLKHPFEPVGNFQITNILLWQTSDPANPILLAANESLITVFEKINDKWLEIFNWNIPAPILQWYQSENLLLLRTDHGVTVYRLDIPKRRIASIGENAEITSHCEFGHFYRNRRDTGAVTRDWNGKVQFYKLVESTRENKTSPLRWLRDDRYRGQLEEKETDMVLVREIREDLEAILVVGQMTGISVFTFDEKYYLVRLMKFGFGGLIVKDLVFIPNEHGGFRKMLLVSDPNTFLFQYHDANYTKVQENLKNLHSLRSKLFVTNDGLCFVSTPRGLACFRTDSWESTLDTSNLPIEDRLVNVLLVSSNTIFFKSVKGQVFTTSTVLIKKRTDINQQERTLEPIINHTQTELPENKTFSKEPQFLSLTDIVTVKTLSECVNVKTGKLCLSLPLVQIVNPLGIDLVQRLDYIQPGSRMRDPQGIAGCGWRLELNYICLLAEVPHGAHRYVWNRNGVVLQLEQCGFGAGSIRFGIRGIAEELFVEYFDGEEKWVVEGDRFRYTFGGEAVQRTVRHRDYAGPVVGGQNLAVRSVAWYLTEVQSEQYVQRFLYELEEVHIEQFKVTHAVLIRQIADSLENCIKFEYDSKRPEEYKDHLLDRASNLPIQTYCTKFLHKLTLDSRQFRNCFHFQYVFQDNERYLRAILQLEEMVHFDYTSLKSEEFEIISSITLPDKSTYNFQYELLNDSLITEKNFEIPVQDQPKVFHTSQNVIISYIGLHQLSVEIYEHRLKKSVGHFKLGRDKPLTYILKADEVHVAVALVFESGIKQISLLTKSTEHHWERSSSEISIEDEESFKFGSNFVVIYTKSSLKAIYRWAGGSFERCTFPKSFEQVENLTITTSEDAFLMCCNKVVWIVQYRTWKNSFDFDAVLELETRNLSAFDSLDCSESERNVLMEAFLSSSIYMFHNVIAVTDLQQEASNFNLLISLFHLNESLKIVKTASFTQFITKFEKNFDLFNREVVVECFLEDGKLQIRLKNLPRGVTPSEEQIRQCYERLLELLGKKLRAGLFQLHQIAEGFRCGDNEYLYDGEKWILKSSGEQSFDIDEGITFKRRENAFSLVNSKGTILYEGLSKKNSSVISNKYFLAYQSESDSRYVLLNNISSDHCLPCGEQILTKTDHMLVTLKPNNIIEKGSILTFHNLALHYELLKNRTIQRSCLTIGNDTFRNVYQYAEPEVTPAGLIFHQTTKIPQQGFGYVRYLSTEGGEREEFFTDSEQILARDYSRIPKDSNTSRKSILYDSREKLEIVDCSPYCWKRQQVCFYGFEQYERIPEGWDLSRDVRIVRDGFAASGRSFGKVEQRGKIVGHVVPQGISNGMFRFVCLVRTGDHLEVGRDFGGVTAINGDRRLIGRVFNRTESNWYAVELEIFIEESNAVKIEISSNSTLEVDHFWFAPVDFDFKAKVYDPINGGHCGEIDRFGRTKRFFYDICQRQALATDFDEKLESFVTFAKTSDANGLRMKTQVETRRGFLESFERCSEMWKVNRNSGLSVRPYGLHHVGDEAGTITLIEDLPDKVAIGFNYSLQEESNVDLQYGIYNILMKRTSIETNLVVNSSYFNIPTSGSILIIFQETRLIITVDGSVLLDQLASNTELQNQLTIHLSGIVHLEMLRLALEPLIRVQYIDASDSVIQELQITNGSDLDIQESVYDPLHRLVFQTVWTRYRCPSTPMVRYYEEFVDRSNDLFEHGIMRGLVSDLNPAFEGFPYTSFHYEKAPIAKQLRRDMPGRRSREEDTPQIRVPDVLERMYPRGEGFSKVRKRTSVKITDAGGNTVALYEEFPGSKSRLSTFEYGDGAGMVAKFCPLYHERVETLLGKDRWKVDREDRLQKQWGSWYEYDQDGRVIEECGPDKGRIRYRYEGKLLVEKQHGSTVVKYSYDHGGQLRAMSCAGRSIQHFRDQHLHNSGRMYSKRKIVSEVVEEVNIFDFDENLLETTIKIDSAIPKEVTIRFEYDHNKVSRIVYPEDNLELVFSYDPNGRLTGIGDTGNPYRYIRNIYNANGLQSSQIHSQNNGESFVRTFAYGNAFYPTAYEDPFMKQTISYGADSYGGLTYDHRKVTAVQTEHKWLDKSDPGAVRLSKDSFPAGSEQSYELLKLKGIIDSDGIVTKSFYPDLYPELPTNIASNENIQRILTQNFPKLSGYRCDYGIDNQLIRAKYFIEDEKTQMRALTVDSFNGLTDLSKSCTEQIWRKLIELGIIIEDNVLETAHGKKGRSMLNEDIKSFLGNKGDFIIYCKPIENLLLHSIANKVEISRKMFLDYFLRWNHPIHSQTYEQKLLSMGQSIWKMLSTHNFLADCCLQALSPSFREALSCYSDHFRSIVRILYEAFAVSLGSSPADVESYGIDSNGNHRCFRTGFRWFNMSYSEYGNRLESVTVTDPVERGPYRIRHDEQGNVVEARHRDIVRIEYDMLVNRASKVTLEDGTCVKFWYNSRGERVMKRVELVDRTFTERIYVRDGKGRCLVDYHSVYSKLDELQDQITTYYIHDNRRLVGFIRDNLYYNVLTDHEGSIRLILLDGQIMAAYDYMPYGQIMRKHEVDSRSGTVFKFTGQEYDEELGLYNYHARLYDPDLGRFLQVDPLEQYASPYKYAGNSPLDMVDPDGRFAFLIPIAIVGGAYLGGLIYNSSAKPWEWDWKDRGTYLSIAGGAATGGIFSGLLGLAGTGLLLGAYLGGASTENSWFPRDWKWDKSTWFGIFAGGASGVLLPNSWASLVKATTATQSTLAFAIFGGVVYAGGNYALNWRKFQSPNPLDWDWSHPAIYYRLFAGLTMSINVANSAFSFVNLLDQMTDCVNVFGVLETAKDSAALDAMGSMSSLEVLAQNRALFEQAFPHAIKALTFFVAFMK